MAEAFADATQSWWKFNFHNEANATRYFAFSAISLKLCFDSFHFSYLLLQCCWCCWWWCHRCAPINRMHTNNYKERQRYNPTDGCILYIIELQVISQLNFWNTDRIEINFRRLNYRGSKKRSENVQMKYELNRCSHRLICQSEHQTIPQHGCMWLRLQQKVEKWT